MNGVAKLLGSMLGCGFSPLAPGTVGSFAALVILWLLSPISSTTLIGLIILFYAVGVWAAAQCEKSWGHDPGRFVWDEGVGMMITILAVPRHFIIYLVGFFLFRLFDIIKPWPADRSQRLAGGWGVMTDDVIAAIYANIGLQILFRIVFHSIWIKNAG